MIHEKGSGEYYSRVLRLLVEILLVDCALRLCKINSPVCMCVRERSDLFIRNKKPPAATR